MKKRSFLIFLLYISVLSVVLYGCGSGAGAPGSQGTEDTGVQLSAIVTGTYLGGNTNSVDAFRQECDPGPPPTYEAFADHQAEVTFTASLINPNPTIQPGRLTIYKYTIEYRRSNDSLGAPPIERDTRPETIIITPPLSGTGTTSITGTIKLVDLIRKYQYWDDIFSGRYNYQTPSYINNYTAIFTFYGKNEYGKDFTIKTQMNFQIGSFDNC